MLYAVIKPSLEGVRVIGASCCDVSLKQAESWAGVDGHRVHKTPATVGRWFPDKPCCDKRPLTSCLVDSRSSAWVAPTPPASTPSSSGAARTGARPTPHRWIPDGHQRKPRTLHFIQVGEPLKAEHLGAVALKGGHRRWVECSVAGGVSAPVVSVCCPFFWS